MNNEAASQPARQFSLRTLFKLTTWSAVLTYIVWMSWDHLALTAFMFLLLSPFIFFAEIVDWLLAQKKLTSGTLYLY